MAAQEARALKRSVALADAERAYALTQVSDELRRELDLDGRRAYRFAKRALDIAVSGCSLVALSWLIAGVAIAVKATSPGPAVFKQQRVGKGKRLFSIYKFRTMRTDTPDVPSHELNADEWMTPVGPALRKFSLDELPQLWNIFTGTMSIVGPRPALWNQFDLVAERDKYGANDVPAGLTGWAQINGRDELTIERKAAADGEYVRRRSLLFDLRCFFGTFSKLSGSEVVEDTVPGHDGQGDAAHGGVQ